MSKKNLSFANPTHPKNITGSTSYHFFAGFTPGSDSPYGHSFLLEHSHFSLPLPHPRLLPSIYLINLPHHASLSSPSTHSPHPLTLPTCPSPTLLTPSTPFSPILPSNPSLLSLPHIFPSYPSLLPLSLLSYCYVAFDIFDTSPFSLSLSLYCHCPCAFKNIVLPVLPRPKKSHNCRQSLFI